jgi:hypothetical protein
MESAPTTRPRRRIPWTSPPAPLFVEELEMVGPRDHSRSAASRAVCPVHRAILGPFLVVSAMCAICAASGSAHHARRVFPGRLDRMPAPRVDSLSARSRKLVTIAATAVQRRIRRPPATRWRW